MGYTGAGSAVIYLFVAWALALPVIIALGSVFRIIERRGPARLFSLLALLGITLVMLSVLVPMPSQVTTGSAIASVLFWLISLAMSTRRRAMIELGLVALVLLVPLGAGLWY